MKTLYSVTEVAEMILKGKILLLAGEEDLLKMLPSGKWMGGTIPYFMTENGGLLSHNHIHVVELPDFISESKVVTYASSELNKIPTDYFSNGVCFITVPAFTETHENYAKNCATYNGIFDNPLLGWVTGFDLNKKGASPKTFNGFTKEVFKDRAVAMHVNLPDDKFGKINILNLFKPGKGDRIQFLSTGFEIERCLINDKEVNFYDYLKNNKIDIQLPLVANYLGANINVSFQNLDEAKKTVTLYAPIFKDVEYRVADPIGNYEREFEQELQSRKVHPVFSCNCILNYLYANLEGKKTGNIVGPMTFGEIAYILLNQTMVYMTFEEKT